MKNAITENLNVKFINAEVTDTRLMGALGLYVHWEVSDSTGDCLRLRQFLRFDVDLSAIEFMAFARDDDHRRLADLLHEYFGSLGGKMVKLTERQTLFLGNYFMTATRNAGHEIPEDVAQVDFFSDRPVTLSEEEMGELMDKICVRPESDYGVVNYFLMRAFAKDLEIQKYLFDPDGYGLLYHDISFPAPGELIRNNIEPFDRDVCFGKDGRPVNVYLCESTVAVGSDNYLVLSEIHVDTQAAKVLSIEKTHVQRMSSYESIVVINRPEFISCFEIVSNEKALRRRIASLSGNAMAFEHEAGDLYMVMNDNNDHVEKKTYRISDDVKAIFFFTHADQLLVVGSQDMLLSGADELLASYIAADNIIEIGSYQMETPVFSEFIDSDYDDFEEFLEDMELE